MKEFYKLSDVNFDKNEYLYGMDLPLKMKTKDNGNIKILKGRKKYIVATSNQIFKHIKSLPDNEWSYYEYWQDNPVKLFMDIDIKYYDKELADRVLDEAKSRLTRILNKDFGINVSEILVESAHRSDKISYHLKLPNVKFSNILHQKKFWYKYHDDFFIDDKYDLVDMSVYQIHMPLKLFWNHKGYQSDIHKSIPINGDQFTYENFKKYSTIIMNNNEQQVPDIDIDDEIVSIIKGKRGKKQKQNAKNKLRKSKIDLYNNYQPDYPDTIIKEPMGQLDITRSLNYWTWINVGMALKVLWGRSNQNDNYYKTWIEFSKQYKYYDEEECEIFFKRYFRTQDKYNRYLYGKTSIIRWAMEDNPLYRYNEDLRDLYLESRLHDYYGIEIDYINERYLPELDLTNIETLFIKSGQGTDKTGKVIKLISKMDQRHENSLGLLCCITRRNLATTITYKSREGYFGYDEQTDPLINIIDYKDVKYYQLHDIRYLAITPNSLKHLIKEEKLPRKKYLWIDEITPFLHYLTSNNLSDRRKTCISILQWYIKNVDYLIITDADIDDDALKIIMDIRSDRKAKMIWNKYKWDKNEYEFIVNYKGLINKCKKLLEKGENVYLCCDTLTKSKQLAKHFEKYNPLVYNSESNKETRDKLKDILNEWCKSRIIITNSVNEYGVSFDDLGDKDSHFNTIFAIFKGNTITAQGANQLLHRVRHTKSKSIYIHLEKNRRNYYETDLKEIKDIINHGEDMIKKITGMDEVKNNILSIDKDGNIIEKKDGIYDEILARTLRSKYESLNSFDRWLRYYITDGGGKIVQTTDIEEVDEIEEIDILEEDADKIYNADNYTTDDIDKLNLDKDYTQEEIYGMKKYYMKRRLGLHNISRELIKKCIKEGFDRQCINFRLFYGGNLDKKLKEELDEEEIKNVSINSRYMKLYILKDLARVIGWDLYNFDEEKEYIGGKNAKEPSEEIKKYIMDNRKILGFIYGNYGRIRIKNLKETGVMDLFKRIVESLFGTRIIKKEENQLRNGNRRVRQYKYSWYKGDYSVVTKLESSQNNEMCSSKSVTDSNSEKMPITNDNTDLNESIEKEISKKVSKNISISDHKNIQEIEQNMTEKLEEGVSISDHMVLWELAKNYNHTLKIDSKKTVNKQIIKVI